VLRDLKMQERDLLNAGWHAEAQSAGAKASGFRFALHQVCAFTFGRCMKMGAMP
jgi:hypothetical protein